MKRAIVLGIFLSCGAVSAATVNYGNDTYLGFDSHHVADFLLGQSIAVTETSELIAAGIIFSTTGYNGNIGIYSTGTDGKPFELLATTGAFSVDSTGVVEVPFLSSVTVGPGEYWFMAVYDDVASLGEDEFIPENLDRTVYFIDYTFAAALPSTFGDPLEYTGRDMNYYISATVVPLPGALWLLLSALSGAAWIGRRGAAT